MLLIPIRILYSIFYLNLIILNSISKYLVLNSNYYIEHTLLTIHSFDEIDLYNIASIS